MLVSKKKGWIEAMKIQQRGAALLLCVALIVSALAGCGGKDGPAEQRPAADTVEYTNLNDSASRQLLERLLSDAGVSEERMEDFFSRVDRFNDSVSAEWLTQGFETAGITETKYDPYEMQDLWTEKNRAFPGYNCRITAMSLFGGSSLNDFRALYASMKAENSTEGWRPCTENKGSVPQ